MSDTEMSDTALRTRLTAAVDDTTVPPGLAHAAVSGGRARRRRRQAGMLALATVAVVGAVWLRPDPGPTAREAQVAQGGAVTDQAGLAWARSLPEGAAPQLPFFGDGGLYDNGIRYDVPQTVDRSVAPRTVAGGWLVAVFAGDAGSRLAVLHPDGTLIDVPSRPLRNGSFDSTLIAVSPDGRQVAFADLVTDLATMNTTELPHQPRAEEQGGFSVETKVIGYTDGGLVYQAAPFHQGIGATWLWRADGSTTRIDLPAGSHLSDGDPADVAVSFDYAEDNSDTCITTYRLRGESWQERGTGCLGESLGEALATSPDADWLLTDDLPRIWNLSTGQWDRVEMPSGIGPAQMLAQGGGAVWESADTFVLPIADRWSGPVSPAPEFVQHVQVVRCSLATGTCERAGEEQTVQVTSTMWGATDLRFARR